MAEYIKHDEFISIALGNQCDPHRIIAYIKQNIDENYSVNITHMTNRVNNYKRKGLLPLDSGNSVEPATVLKGVSTLYNDAGQIVQQWVKSDVSKEQILSAYASAVEELSKALPAYAPKPDLNTTLQSDDMITIYPIGDAHIGMLAHAEETGADNDLKIAEARLLEAMALAVESALPTEEAFIIDVGDYLHADNSNNTTPRGNNPLDVDGRYHKVMYVALYTAAKLIETALEKHSKVHWRSAEGNHNPNTSVVINMFLSAYFRDEPRVVVHTSPSMYFYHQFGKNLIGVTHGHTCKPDKLGELMAVDCSDVWSSTKFRYWYVGHIHHVQVKEYPSCIIETFRTLTPKDAWHASMGYRSGQDMKIITLHKDYGEVARSTINLAMLKNK